MTEPILPENVTAHNTGSYKITNTEQNWYVYGLYNPDGSIFYIGKGCNGRINAHRKQALRKVHKPGPKTAKIRIILELWKLKLDFKENVIKGGLSEKEALDLEQNIIADYGRIDLGTGCLTNRTDGGDGPYGAKISEATRKKMSARKKGANHPNYGKHLSQQTRDRISKGNKGKIRTPEQCRKLSVVGKGRKLTEQHRKKIGEGLKGHRMTEDNKRKLIEANTGREYSEETRKNMSLAHIGVHAGEKHPMYGKHHSEETKQKLRAANLGKSLSTETIRKMSESNMGRIVTEETRRKISESGRRHFQIKPRGKLSPETRQKMSEAQKRRWEILRG